MPATKVAIVGLGTVGTGVARILGDHARPIARHAGGEMRLVCAVVRDMNRPRDFAPADGVLTDNLSTLISDPEIKVVAQLIGGLEPARTIMLQLLEAGKDVVTANKALLAEHGPELFDRARKLERSIAFEAAVAGGIPIVTNISQCLSANQITSLSGILNGTSNFIVTQMEEHGVDYATAVQDAQRRGYAEADPAMDVDGTDTAQKLAILAHLSFGAWVSWRDIPTTGIDAIHSADQRSAQEMGYRIKLLAVASLEEDGLELHVSPTLVKLGTPLAEVRGVYNAISVVGNALGRVFFQGLGAGQMPTASAVVADMIDMVAGRSAITFQRLDLWSNRENSVVLKDHAKVMSRYYLRFMVDDHPGVLAEITGILGHHQISIASVLQHELGDVEGNDVPLMIMTHLNNEGAVQAAVEEIDRLESVRMGSVTMRVLD